MVLFCLEFRNRSRVILIATDVAARGLGRSFARMSFLGHVHSLSLFSVLLLLFAGASYGGGVPVPVIAVLPRENIYY